MSDFALHRYFKPSEPVPQIDQNTGILDHFGELNSSVFESFNVTYCSSGSFLGCQYQTPENPLLYSHNIFGTSHSFCSKDYQVPTIDLTIVDSYDNEKRSATEPSDSSSEVVCSAESANQTKEDDKKNKKNGLEKEKKRRYKRKEQDKPKEVIHVRAKRGQATDTHSLAERVRRERINNKLKCLQDLVPGCQKTMGMVTMLDEIISYVHSLKNQVEFLSMELEVACSDQLSRNKRATKNAQETGSHEAQEIEEWVREQY